MKRLTCLSLIIVALLFLMTSSSYAQTTDCQAKCRERSEGDSAALIRCIRVCGAESSRPAPGRDRTGRGGVSSSAADSDRTATGNSAATQSNTEAPKDFDQEKQGLLDSLKK
jgi:hypothetical protein